ncbi:hypothetical protein LSH36_379g02033 [Paralvinella palmiformis]|uniref:Uncharacterized protein n=1 Tax=Paralvinella palmiformis TaxID=53620 RepID=A0AAD9JDM8_9ANNE|nr:hypothetical protein LSH36_379g02033 [Paralvinella palmiformis]
MSIVTNPSRISKEHVAVPEETKGKQERNSLPAVDVKLESRLNIKDLESLQEAFMAEGDGYDNRLSLNKEQFCEALSLILNKGSADETNQRRVPDLGGGLAIIHNYCVTSVFRSYSNRPYGMFGSISYLLIYACGYPNAVRMTASTRLMEINSVRDDGDRFVSGSVQASRLHFS